MKNLLIVVCLLISKSMSAQYVSYGANSGGVSLGAGMISVTGIDISVHYDFPIFSATKPHYSSLNVGKMYWLADTYLITPKVGIAAVNSKYEYKGGLRELKEHKPVFELEFGKQRDNARVSLITKYCKNIYFGFSAKVLFGNRERNCIKY